MGHGIEGATSVLGAAMAVGVADDPAAKGAHDMARIVNFPTGQVSDSVGAALGTVLGEYARRRDTVALAFQLANLSDEKLAASLAEATPGEVSSLKWFLQADAVAFFGLAELLTDVLDSVDARLEAMRRGLI